MHINRTAKTVVALRKESVDRNTNCTSTGRPKRVALRKESVDRNACQKKIGRLLVGSLSARRAWIEIGLSFARKIRPVASLSARRAWIEIGCWLPDHSWWLSLSARRAWIEIVTPKRPKHQTQVALRKESVDRNLYYGDDLTFADGSLSARRAWIEIHWMMSRTGGQSCRSPQGERG